MRDYRPLGLFAGTAAVLHMLPVVCMGLSSGFRTKPKTIPGEPQARPHVKDTATCRCRRKAASGPSEAKKPLKTMCSAPRKDPQHAVDLLRLLCTLPGLSSTRLTREIE